MTSNFLGDVGQDPARSLIISYNEVLAREGQNLQKGMTYRSGRDGKISVFVIFAGEDAPHKTVWNAESEILTYEGHDVTTAGKEQRNIDQQIMYEDGRPTDNGKFLKEATLYKDGAKHEPHQIQIYEKLDAAVFFDKGIFNLVDAKMESDPPAVDPGIRAGSTRKVARFYLVAADALAGESAQERMIPIDAKVEVWGHDQGRCAECGEQSGLHFQFDPSGSYSLVCALHNKRKVSLL